VRTLALATALALIENPAVAGAWYEKDAWPEPGEGVPGRLKSQLSALNAEYPVGKQPAPAIMPA
jgi:hypothetical protein